MISGKYNKDLMMRYNKLKHNQELKYVWYQGEEFGYDAYF